MINNKKVFHCFFEQSGTFKNEFKKLGYQAYDYDILNDFKETDYVIDLFKEIEQAYENKKSIFDNIKPTDMVIAFFPCTRFEAQIQLHFRGQAVQQKNWDMRRKLENCLELHSELSSLYEIITKLVLVCINKKIPLIIENPYSNNQHYLTKFWCVPVAIIDKDRTLRGDYYEKPTQYWFINCEPKNNFIFEPLEYVKLKKIKNLGWTDDKTKTKRSMIHPQYANRFIREFII